MSRNCKCHPNTNVTKTQMSLKRKCSQNWDVTKTKISPKYNDYKIANITKMLISSKHKYHQTANFQKHKCHQSSNITKTEVFQMRPVQLGLLVKCILSQIDFQVMACLIPDLFDTMLLSAHGKTVSVSRMQDFFKYNF